MAILLKTAPVRVSFIQIMQVRVQNKGKSVWKSRYVGDVSQASTLGMTPLKVVFVGLILEESIPILRTVS